MNTDAARARRALWAIFLIVVIDVLGLAIVFPLLPFYAEHFGATPTVVGSLVTVYSACQLLSGPLLGKLSDKFGRKPMLIISQIGTCVGFVILACAHALWVIFLSRFVDGVTAGNLPIAQAFISDITEPKNRARAFGLIGIAFGIGFFIGPGISGYLARYGYDKPAWVAAGLSFLSVVCSSFLLPDTRGWHAPAPSTTAPPAKTPWAMWSYLTRPVLGRLLLQFFCFGLGFSCFMSGFALFAERRFVAHGHAFGATEVGYFYTYIGFLTIFWQGYLLGKLIKRFGEKNLVLFGFAAQTLGYAALAAIFHLPWLYLCGAVSSFGSGIVRPALTSLISQSAARTEQGAVLGFGQSLVSFAQVMAPLLAGYLIGLRWLDGWALTAGGFACVGWLLAVRARFQREPALA